MTSELMKVVAKLQLAQPLLWDNYYNVCAELQAREPVLWRQYNALRCAMVSKKHVIASARGSQRKGNGKKKATKAKTMRGKRKY